MPGTQGKRGRGDRGGGSLKNECPCSVVTRAQESPLPEEGIPALTPAGVLLSLLAPELGLLSEAGPRHGDVMVNPMDVDSSGVGARGALSVKPEPAGEGREGASAVPADTASEARAADEGAPEAASSTPRQTLPFSGQRLEPILTLALGCFKSGWVCPRCAGAWRS